MVIAYLCLALWFWLADMIASAVRERPCRPLIAAAYASVWPISMGLALIGCAVIIRRMELDAQTTKPAEAGSEGQGA